MLPRRTVEVLCFRRTEIPGKEGAKAIRCREFRSKAYPCQESESALVEGSVCAASSTRPRCVQTKCVATEYGTQQRFGSPDGHVPRLRMTVHHHTRSHSGREREEVGGPFSSMRFTTKLDDDSTGTS